METSLAAPNGTRTCSQVVGDGKADMSLLMRMVPKAFFFFLPMTADTSAHSADIIDTCTNPDIPLWQHAVSLLVRYPQHESSSRGPRATNTHAWELPSSRGQHDWSWLRFLDLLKQIKQGLERRTRPFFSCCPVCEGRHPQHDVQTWTDLGRKPVPDLLSASLKRRLKVICWGITGAIKEERVPLSTRHQQQGLPEPRHW